MSFRCAWTIPILQKGSPQLAGRKNGGSYLTYFLRSGALRPYKHSPSPAPALPFWVPCLEQSWEQTALCIHGHHSREMLTHAYRLPWKPQSSRHTPFCKPVSASPGENQPQAKPRPGRHSFNPPPAAGTAGRDQPWLCCLWKTVRKPHLQCHLSCQPHSKQLCRAGG